MSLTVSPPLVLPGPSGWSYTLRLPCDSRAPGIARATLRAVLRVHGMGGCAGVAALLASELVTNAFLHSGGPCSMGVEERVSGRLRVSVEDSDACLPPGFHAPRGAPVPTVPDEAESGRGLSLVRAFASDWGGRVLGGAGGKVLWFELDPARDTERPPRHKCR